MVRRMGGVVRGMRGWGGNHAWPEQGDGNCEATGIVGEAYHELVVAVEKETPERRREEALDVAVTALRMWAGEHERRGA